MKKIITLALIMVSALLSATIINIPADFSSIQAGINATATGDTVLVAEGTYIGDIIFGGRTITVASLFLTTGNEDYIEQTVILGTGTTSVVRFSSGETNTSKLVGFTISGGTGYHYSSSYVYGGGIYIKDGSPNISYCTISNNTAYGTSYCRGGGIYIYDGSPNISHCTISNNTASGSQCGYGGGIYIYYGTPTISNCNVSNNTASGSNYSYGGGIYIYYGTPTISHCTISHNTVSGGSTRNGGGIYMSSSNAIISKMIISNNSSSQKGGGIYAGGGSPQISNSIITCNIAANEGGGIYSSNSTLNLQKIAIVENISTNNIYGGLYANDGLLSLTNVTIANNDSLGIYNNKAITDITNSIIWGNEIQLYGESSYDADLSLSYCDIEGGVDAIIEEINYCNISTTGIMINEDPFFVGDDSGNYNLMGASPCIDAGNPYSDFDPDGTIVDMGAFYFDQNQPDFVASENDGYSPLEIIFSDISNDSYNRWEWDFENDGVIDSYEQNPTHTFYERGSYSVSLTVIDTFSNYYNNTIVKENLITVLNSVPFVQNQIAEFSFDENSNNASIDLNTVFADVDLAYGDVLEFSYFGSTNIQVEIEDGIATLYSIEDWNGTENITFVATDDQQTSVSEEVAITINPEDDVPILDITGNFALDEDSYSQSYDFSQYCTQAFAEEDQLILSAENSENIEVTVTNMEVIFQATTENWFGTEDVTFYLEDYFPEPLRNSKNSKQTHNRTRTAVSQTISVTINPVNDVHSFDIPSEFSFEEDDEYIQDFSGYVEDIEGGDFVFSVSGNTNVLVNIIGDIVTFTATENWNGSEILIFSATDVLDDIVVEDEIIINVLPQNDAPSIILPDEFAFNEDTSLVVDFSNYITDIDEDTLLLSFSGNNEISLEIYGINVIFTAPENWNGNEMITFFVSDNQNRLIAEDYVNVVVNPVNDAQNLILPDEFTFTEDTTFVKDFSSYVEDIEGGEFVFSVSGNTNILVNIIGDIVTFTATENWNGSEILTFSATDVLDDIVAEDEIIINVLPQNDAPSIILPTEISFDEDTNLPVDFSLYIFDIDEDVLTLSVEGNDEIDVTIVGTGVLFEVAENWNGNEVMTFSVNDNQNRLVAEDNVNIVVNPVNDPPVFVSEPATEVLENETYSYSLFAEDVENDLLTYSAEVFPSWLTFTPEIGLLTGIPTNDDVGQHNITVTVTDGIIPIPIEQSFVINVTNVNNPPVITFPNQFYFAEDGVATYDFEEYISDVDNDFEELVLSWSGNSNIEVTFDDWEVTFSSIQENWFGDELITFYVDDGETRINKSREISAESIIVSCVAVNDIPELLNWLPSELNFDVVIDSTQNFIIQVEDCDSEVEYEWFVDGTLITGEIENNYSHTFSSLGDTEISVEVSDEVSLISLAWQITVNDFTCSDCEIMPVVTKLAQNYPNPFNPLTTISFSIPYESKVNLIICNIKGQKVKTLINNELDRGNHSVIWNGVDDSGKAVSSGLYYYKLQLNGRTEAVKKCMLMK